MPRNNLPVRMIEYTCRICRRRSLINRGSALQCLRCTREEGSITGNNRRHLSPSVECPSCRILHLGHNVGAPYCGRCNRRRRNQRLHRTLLITPMNLDLILQRYFDAEISIEGVRAYIPPLIHPRDIQLKRIQADPSKECTICIETFGEEDHCTELPCNHCFHHDCIYKWVQSAPSCPLCRSQI